MNIELETVYRSSIVLIFLAGMGTGLTHRKRADRAGGVVSRREDPRWFWICMSFVGPPMLLSIVAFIIQPRWLDWSAVPLPVWVRLTGLPLGLLFVISFHWMFRNLGHNITPTSMPRADATLITTGPYRWIRHPMYTFSLLMFTSLALLTASWFIAMSGVCAFILLALRSRIEEQRLIDKFGAAYREYQQVTGRFFPKWWTPETKTQSERST